MNTFTATFETTLAEDALRGMIDAMTKPAGKIAGRAAAGDAR